MSIFPGLAKGLNSRLLNRHEGNSCDADHQRWINLSILTYFIGYSDDLIC